MENSIMENIVLYMYSTHVLTIVNEEWKCLKQYTNVSFHVLFIQLVLKRKYNRTIDKRILFTEDRIINNK